MTRPLPDRTRTISSATQDYVSRQVGDTRIDAYVTEPARGVTGETATLTFVEVPASTTAAPGEFGSC